MSQIRVIISHKEMGIYLGSCMGMGFWSKLDSAGQDKAVTFDNIAQAKEVIQSWNEPHNTKDYYFTRIQIADLYYATISEVLAAGLEGWEVDKTPPQISKEQELENKFQKVFQDEPVYSLVKNSSYSSDRHALVVSYVRNSNIPGGWGYTIFRNGAAIGEMRVNWTAYDAMVAGLSALAIYQHYGW